MADRIKGITVEIGGDTTGLKKALQGVNKEINSTQSQLKDVERLLKLDPTNTTLLEQRQRLLAQAVESTSTKLSALKDAETQVQRQFQKGEVSREQYEALQREIIATEQRLKSLEEVAAKSSVSLQKLGQHAMTVSEGADKVATVTAPLTKGILGLGAAALATVPATEELRSDLSKLDNNARQAGVGVDAAREAFQAFNVVSDETDSSVEATANLLQAGFTESNLQKAVEGLAGAYLAFPDTMKIESLADSLQETLATGTATGQFGELLDRLGVGAENFSDALAECATEADKQQLALKTLANAGLMDSYNAWKQNNAALVEGKEASADLQEQMAELAESIQPVVTTVTNVAARFAEWFNSLSTGQKTAVAALLAIVAAISPVATVIGTVSSALAIFSGAATTGSAAATGLASVMTFLTGPAGIVVAAIGGITAAIVLLWNNCEAFREAVTAAWTMIQEVFQVFLNWLQETFSPVWSTVIASLQVIFQTFQEALSIAWETITIIFQTFLTFLQETFGISWADLFAAMQLVVTTFGTAIQMAIELLTTVFQTLLTFLTTVFLSTWKSGWANIQSLFQAFSDNIGGIIDGVKQAFQGVIDFITGVFTGNWRKAWQGVQDIFSGIFGALVEIVKVPINGIIGLLNKAIGFINGLIDGVNELIGVLNKLGAGLPTIPTIPTIPLLAKGGILEAGSAIVGEAGPELLSLVNGKARVTPLSASGEDGGSGQGGKAAAGYQQTLNFYTAAMTPAEVARQTRNATRKMLAGARA